MNPDWGDPIARRGEFAMIVLTRAAAVRKLSPLVIHREAVLVSLLMPDGCDSATPLNHASADAARSFIREMQPHTLDVLGDRAEDVDALAEALRAALAERPAGISLH